MTLTDFLLARIAEDEAVAKACIADVGAYRAGEQFDDGSGIAELDAFPSYPWGSKRPELTYMAGPGHPTHVLAECEAKRRIVRTHQVVVTQRDEEGALARLTLCLLALPYADHPDYREEWRP